MATRMCLAAGRGLRGILLPKTGVQCMRRGFRLQTAPLAATVQFKLSDIGEGIKEVTVKEWFVKEGQTVAQFDNICEVQSDKASVTITSRFDGVVRKLHYGVEDVAQVGKPLVDIEVEGDDSKKDEKDDAASSSSSSSSSSSDSDGEVKSSASGPSAEELMPSLFRAIATPAVRRIASEHKIQITDIKGTGKGGRVLKEDILAFVDAKTGPSKGVQAARQDRVEPIKGVMKGMLRTMTAALEIPHFMYSDEIDMGNLMRVRQDLKEAAFSRGGVKLTYMPFLIKAASLALQQYPIINSSLDSARENIIFKANHNIGVAMDTPLGLVVPNIKRVQDLSVFDVAAELNRLQQLGLKSSLKQEDLTGGTFSLSNIGIIGGMYTKPVLLPPEVAIGGIGKIQKLPRFNSEGAVVAAHIMCISWAADHRVLDGVTLAKFSNKWKEYVENPHSMLLDMK